MWVISFRKNCYLKSRGDQLKFKSDFIFASGGLKDGLDIAKCVALGASLGGMAGQFLKAAAVSTEKTVEMMKLTKRQIEVTMQMTCAANINQLQKVPSPCRRGGKGKVLGWTAFEGRCSFDRKDI